MALTSSSTASDAYAQLNNNLAWEGDPTAAAAWLEAARWLSGNRANSAKAGVSLNWADLEAQILRASKYVLATTKPSSARRASFTRGRARRS